MLRLILFLIIILCSGTSLAKDEISKGDILNILISNQDVQLSSKQNVGCKNQRLGEYLALLISNGSEGDVYRLSATCRKHEKAKAFFSKPKDIKNFLECEFEAHTSDKKGVSPWTYSFRFGYNVKTKEIDKSRMACPGTP